VSAERKEGAPRWAALAVVVAGLLALAAGVAIVLLDERPRAVEPASRSLAAAVVVPPSGTVCERSVDIPARAGRVQLVVSTGGKPGPPLEVTVEKTGRILAAGRHPGRFVDTPVSIRLDNVLRRVADARVCASNEGRVEIAVLGAPLEKEETATLGWIDEGGTPTGPPARVTVRGKRVSASPGRLRFEWQYPEEASALSLSDEVTERFGLAKASFFGSGSIWVAFGLTGLASLGALALVVRMAGRR
jgi:hypothetical protein